MKRATCPGNRVRDSISRTIETGDEMGYQEPEGLILEYNGSWELAPLHKRYDLTVFLRSLPLLFGDDFTLVLTETTAEEVISFAASRVPKDRPKLAFVESISCSIELSLVCPFVRKVETEPLFMRLNVGDAAALAEISMHYAEPEVCMHLSVYRDNEVLMECHDAGCSDGVPFVAGSIEEDKIKAFCETVGLAYSRYVMED